MNYPDLDGGKHRKINPGFTVGLVGLIIAAPVNLVALLIAGGQTYGDWIAWGIQLLIYFFASQVAAQQHYNAQERNPDALRGVRGAGIGAAITVAIGMWLFIFIRDVVMSALQFTVPFEPFSTFCRVVIDVLLAIGLGAWGGSIVEKKYKGFEGYDSKNF